MARLPLLSFRPLLSRGRGALAAAVLLIFSPGAQSAAAAPLSSEGRSQPRLERKSYESTATGKRREYYLYLPAGYDSEEGRQWPVILFLHGGGERGDGLKDLEKTLIHGPLREAWVQRRDLPFIIIQPQLPVFGMEEQVRPLEGFPSLEERGSGPPPARDRGEEPSDPMARVPEDEPAPWGKKGPPNGWWKCEQDLLNMVDATLRHYRADPDRVYLTGLSYGGFGTWHLAAAYPHRWAAAAPICGAGDAEQMPRLAKAATPVWVFQGGRDRVVKPGWVLETAKALEEAGHPDVRMTVHEDLGHNVWTRVYEGWDLYQWFLSQRRGAE